VDSGEWKVVILDFDRTVPRKSRLLGGVKGHI
jgi:hypothetical protein